MLVHRRVALACAFGAPAVTLSSGLAVPATTLAFIFSSSALLIAADAAALSGHDHLRRSEVAS
jgi:hypothetical protein